ncbi:uncharacterized protein LOC144603545 isoform X2 [Rhinoraja longicauda]
MNPPAHRRLDEGGFQGAFRKEDASQDPGAAASIVAGATPGQAFRRGWPAFAGHASVPARARPPHAGADSSGWPGPAGDSSPQRHGPRGIAPLTSSGQKKMALARVTPMPLDRGALQQGPYALPATEAKGAQVRRAPSYGTPGGGGQPTRAFSDAISTAQRNVGNNIAPSTQMSTVGIVAWGSNHIRQILPVLNTGLPGQQNVLNIHFNYTPAPTSGRCTVTSPLSSSGLQAQRSVTAPGSHLSASRAGVKDPATPQLSPWSLAHGSGLAASSSRGLDVVSQQHATVPSAGFGGSCDRNVSPHSDVPHFMTILHSVFGLVSKDEGKQTAPSPSLGFNGESCQPPSAQLPPRDEGGKQKAAGHLLVVPPSTAVPVCQSPQSSTVYPLPSTATHEASGSLNGNVGLVGTSSIVMETLASMSELSKYSAAPDANFWTSGGRRCEQVSSHGSSTVDGRYGQRQSCADSLPTFKEMSSPKDLSSLSELRGKKRNSTERPEVPRIYAARRDPTFCDIRERLDVIRSPTPKRFLASALEDVSQGAGGCQSAVPCPSKEGANSPELKHGGHADQGEAAHKAGVGDKEDICITGVFSLEDTGQWEFRPRSPASVNPAAGSATLAADQVSGSSAARRSLPLAPILNDKTSPCHAVVTEERWQTTDKSPANSESRRCHLVTGSPAIVHARPVLRSSASGESPRGSSDTPPFPTDLAEGKEHCSHSVLPSTLAEHNPKLVSDKSLLPLEVSGQNPPSSLDKETRDLDGLLRSIEVSIEALQDFWNPGLPPCAGRLVCKQDNLQGGTVGSKTPGAEETASSLCAVAPTEDKMNRVDLLVEPDCGQSTDIKVLGHAEILTLLAEISNTNSKARLPVDAATPGPCARPEGMRQSTAPNANRAESVESSAKVPEFKECRDGGERSSAGLLGPGGRNGATKKGRHQEKKIYCCINAWLISYGVLGVHCKCKQSLRSKAESQAELPAAGPRGQSSSGRGSQSCAAATKETAPAVNGVPPATRDSAPGEPAAGHAAPGTPPCCRWEGASGEESVPGGRDGGTRAEAGSKVGSPRGPGSPNPSGPGAGGGTDGLIPLVAPEGGLPLPAAEESKDTSQATAETGADEEDRTAASAKEPNEDKTQTVTGDDPSPNVFSEDASDRTAALPCNPHTVKLGFQGAKVLPGYNCRILILDKTYSSSGEQAVLVTLLPLSGQPRKAKEKIRNKTQ